MTRPQWIDNLTLGVGRGLFELTTRGMQLGLFEAVRVAFGGSSLDPHALSTWVVVLLAYDFLYYWAHRAQHRAGLLWAIHAVHHQPTKMDLSVGLRTAITNSLANLTFFLPLAVLGVPTSVFLGVSAIHLLGMFWLHTPRIGHLGPLERWLSTPALHRVHHSASPAHADKNFGGLLIVWDRIFATYAAPVKVERFGMIGQTRVPGPVAAHVEPCLELLSALRRAGSLWAKLRVLIG